MAGALREAARTVRRDGVVVVIEPVAEGSFFEAMKDVEDETEIRQAAQQKVADAVREGTFGLQDTRHYVWDESFASADAFLERITANSPTRGPIVKAMRTELHEKFTKMAAKNGATAVDPGHHQLVTPPQKLEDGGQLGPHIW